MIGEPLVLGERRHRVIPAGRDGAPLVLLHERGGSLKSSSGPKLVDSLETMTNPPAVLLVDGGDHSYYHDRDDFDWGTHILEEAIPAARERLDTDPRKEAIGGFSMGGFGALDLARQRRFCAVGAHSPALWEGGGQTPEEPSTTPRTSATTCSSSRRSGRACSAGRSLARRGSRRQLPGQHRPARRARRRSRENAARRALTAYWREHVDEYLRFYDEALENVQVTLDVEAVRARFSALRRPYAFFDGPAGRRCRTR